MKLLSEFYDYLLPELPGCTTAFLDLHMVEVARDFCEDTLTWRGDFDAVNLVADQAAYDLDPAEPQSVAVKVLRLTVNDEILWDVEWNKNVDRDEPTYPAHGEPPFSLNAEMTELTLIDEEIPSAAVTDGLEIYGAMKPKFDADRLPDMLLNTYLDTFRKGVLARLMRMAKKPWSNPTQAGDYDSDYVSGKQLAATRMQRGNTRAPLRTRKWG